jgi:hypothetical protein
MIPCAQNGDFNYAKQFQTADVKGQVAVITGSRLKSASMYVKCCLEFGATVIATTRFPVNSALRFLKGRFFTNGTSPKNSWFRFRIYIPSVEIFCNFYIEQRYSSIFLSIMQHKR